MMIRVVAVDDHSLLLTGLKALIANQQDVELVATADHGSKLLDLIREHRPDVAILDLGMKTGEFDPVASVRNAKKQFPNVKILIFTNYDDGVWVRALVEAGASGYMLKSDVFSQHIGQVICALHDGGQFFSPQIAGEVTDRKDQIKLTPQERSILRLLDEGKSTEMVADNLGVSAQRIRNLLVTICDKLEVGRGSGFSPRIAAINKARKLGLLPDADTDANLVTVLSRTEDDDLA